MSDHRKLILPRNAGDRLLLLFFTPCIMLLTAGATFGAYRWEVSGPLLTLLKFVAFEIAFTFLIPATLCFVWAVATPRWLEEILQQAYQKTIIVIGILAAGSIIFLISLKFLEGYS